MELVIDAQALSVMFLAGAKSLEANKEWINELNVFPVPDGDTGTNMSMTIMSAANAVMELDNPDMKTVAKAISSGSLRGARGNSGVILSQLLRGFSKVVQNAEVIDQQIICDAIQRAVETAYKAVMKPKEGTILTVAKAGATAALDHLNDDISVQEYVGLIVASCEETLQKTPDMLPVLKQAGVVDSGGQGLVCFLNGVYNVVLGKDVNLDMDESDASKSAKVDITPKITYLYCMEFMVTPKKPMSIAKCDEFKAFLGEQGECFAVKMVDKAVMATLHTNEPGIVISEAVQIGELSHIKIENIKLEHSHVLITDEEMSETKNSDSKTSDNSKTKEDKPKKSTKKKTKEPEKEIGFVAVATGDGMTQIFSEIGVDYMISGGQTMNPSTDDFLNAIDQVNAKCVFLLPNNKNIVLAANQAASICEEKKVIVIPTKTIPQGITALINFIPDQSAEENEERMNEEIKNVKTGQITYSIRDTVIDDREIKIDDFMGVADSGIVAVNKDMTACFMEMIDALVDEDSALVSIYYGEDASEDSANELAGLITDKYKDVEVEVAMGGQAVYSYIVSVE